MSGDLICLIAFGALAAGGAVWAQAGVMRCRQEEDAEAKQSAQEAKQSEQVRRLRGTLLGRPIVYGGIKGEWTPRLTIGTYCPETVVLELTRESTTALATCRCGWSASLPVSVDGDGVRINTPALLHAQR